MCMLYSTVCAHSAQGAKNVKAKWANMQNLTYCKQREKHVTVLEDVQDRAVCQGCGSFLAGHTETLGKRLER